MRKIPKKNYFILILILGFTVGLVLYSRSWYIMSKEYYAQNSVIKDVAREINENELDSFATENQKFILYVSSGNNGEVKEFEEKFKKSIIKLNIQDYVLYLNLDNVDDYFSNYLRDRFAFNNKIANQFSSKSLSTIYLFEDGRITFLINNVQGYSIKYIESIVNDWSLK